MLLPKEVNEEGEEEDPRQELVEQLLQYKMYKYIAFELKDRQLDADLVLFKKPTIPEEVREYEEPVDLDELLADVTISRLSRIFRDVMKRQNNKIDPVRSKFGRIEKEEVPLPSKIAFVEGYAKAHRKFSFRQLLEGQKSTMHLVVTFLAILELMKTGTIRAIQENTFGEILIESSL
jgi:segregation and condensation protein A